MNFTGLTPIVAVALVAMLVTAAGNAQDLQLQKGRPLPHYTVTDLGTFGGPFSIAYGINNAGQVAGGATLPAGNEHPFLWDAGQLTDLGTLGGPNGNAAGPNGSGELALVAETSVPDPLGEDFCAFGTHLTCLGAVYRNGVVTALPTLGGNNGQATGLNERGQLIGVAEKSTKARGCASPQVELYEAVIWGPKKGEVQELPPLPGDTLGFAIGLNDKGEVVGATGTCANTQLVPFSLAPHAVLWENGSPTDLGNLGGKKVNVAAAINDRSEVVGTSSLRGDKSDPAFLWTQDAGMQDIGTVGSDLSGLPGGFGGINNSSQVVGASCSGYAGSGTCRAFLWQNGVMTDLNTLVPAGSPLYLVFAFQINDVGEIVGLGCAGASCPGSGNMHAFLATPTGRSQ